MSSNHPINSCRRTAIFGLLALGACGFTPVYGPNGSAGVLRDAVRFSAPETVAGFRLRSTLEDRLGRAAVPRFALDVQIDQSLTPATISVDGDMDRFNLVGDATWALTDLSGTVLANGTVDTFTSYSATGSTVATQAAATDAAARLSVTLADLIVARLILAAQDLPR